MAKGPAAAKLHAGSHPYARRLRTVLHNALRGGPNFAGHYAFGHWGCGTGCQGNAIVDTRNGHVYAPTEIDSVNRVFYGHLDCDPEILQFRPDSRLLIHVEVSDEDVAVNYYLWTGKKLNLLSIQVLSHEAICRNGP